MNRLQEDKKEQEAQLRKSRLYIKEKEAALENLQKLVKRATGATV